MHTFIELKALSLSCKDKSQGKMLTRSFRLFFNYNEDTVELISRYDGQLICSTNAKDETTVHIKEDISQWLLATLHRYYSIYFETIKSPEGVKLHHTHYLYSGNHSKVVYIPGKTIVKNDTIIHADNYNESVICPTWNKSYTKKSKLNRAAFTALHKIIPPLDTIDEIKNHKGSNYSLMYRIKTIEDKNANAIFALVMGTNKPNGNDVNILRKLMCLYKGNHTTVNLRTGLQKLINSRRMQEAKIDGAITIESRKNYPN